MLCRHNWHVHKTAEGKSSRYKNLVTEEQAAVLLLFLTVTFGVSTGVIVGSLVNIIAGFLFGIFGMVVYGVIYFNKVVRMEVDKNDPWIPKDKTCLKCNKLIMGATNAAHQKATRLENEAAEAKRLAPFKDAANARYERFMTMRAKAIPHI